MWQTIVIIAVEEERDHFFVQYAHERLRVTIILHVLIGVIATVADRETVAAVEGFRPPAVEDRAIETPVQHDLLTARSRRFQGSARVVQPDIDSLHQVPSDIDVVVFEQHDLPLEARLLSQTEDALQDRLAVVVGGMRLPGEHELHGTLRVGHDLPQQLDVAQHEVRALVRCEPSREADRQSLRIEARLNVGRLTRGESQSLGATLHSIAGEQNHAVLERLMGFPQFSRCDVLKPSPHGRFTRANVPFQW